LKQLEELDIELINSIKNSINKKFFLITSAILILCSMIIYVFIIWIMPIYYYKYQDDKMKIIGAEFAKTLESRTYEDSSGSFTDFISDNNNRLVYMLLFNGDGNGVKLPYELPNASGDYDQTEEEFLLGYKKQKEGLDAEESVRLNELKYNSCFSDNIILANLVQIDIKFKDNKGYRAYIFYDTQPINEASEVLIRLIPVVFIIIILVSFICAFLYSRIITRPIIIISKKAKEMASNMNLDIRCDVNGSDEIGVLAVSINDLAKNLSSSLEELKEMNIILQKDIEREKEIDRKRIDFFNAVSHELKTPITILKGQLEGMIYKIGSYKDRDKYLSHSLGVVDNMEELVKEILTITRMEDDSFKLNLENINLRALIEACIEEMEGLIESKKIIIVKNMERDLFSKVDYKLIKKVFSNIIKNAIIHSPSNSRVNVNIFEDLNRIVFKVENYNVHIPIEEIEEIFNPYYRIEKSRSRSTGGSGLGLYIVKNILELHNISYNLKNTENGVVFECDFIEDKKLKLQ